MLGYRVSNPDFYLLIDIMTTPPHKERDGTYNTRSHQIVLCTGTNRLGFIRLTNQEARARLLMRSALTKCSAPRATLSHLRNNVSRRKA